MHLLVLDVKHKNCISATTVIKANDSVANSGQIIGKLPFKVAIS